LRQRSSPRRDRERDPRQACALLGIFKFGLAMIDRKEMQPLSRTALRQGWQVGGDHVTDAWIAANGLCIGEQDDGLAIRR
jgi:hypothetical protein